MTQIGLLQMTIFAYDKDVGQKLEFGDVTNLIC